jgi:hypothetical protein
VIHREVFAVGEDRLEDRRAAIGVHGHRVAPDPRDHLRIRVLWHQLQELLVDDVAVVGAHPREHLGAFLRGHVRVDVEDAVDWHDSFRMPCLKTAIPASLARLAAGSVTPRRRRAAAMSVARDASLINSRSWSSGWAAMSA